MIDTLIIIGVISYFGLKKKNELAIRWKARQEERARREELESRSKFRIIEKSDGGCIPQEYYYRWNRNFVFNLDEYGNQVYEDPFFDYLNHNKPFNGSMEKAKHIIKIAKERVAREALSKETKAIHEIE